MNEMNAQTVQDNQNKYRYGVLIGNSNEERFGLFLNSQDKTVSTPQTVMKDSYSLSNSVLNKEQFIERNRFPEKKLECEDEVIDQNAENQTEQQKAKQKQKGQDAHILFGHGLKNQDFQVRDYKTTNELSYSLQVKPTTFISSKFYPDQTRNVTTFKDTTKQHELNYKSNLKVWGDKDPKSKNFKPYDEFTKKYDLTYMKIGLRK